MQLVANQSRHEHSLVTLSALVAMQLAVCLGKHLAYIRVALDLLAVRIAMQRRSILQYM